MLGDGTEIELGAGQGWGDFKPGSLNRGELVRVKRIEAPTKDAGAEATPITAAAEAGYKLDQVPRAQATLVSLEPMNGALRALSGGYSFAGNKFNRATQARRQPGSSFKPFLYAAAFERGFNPASIVLDAPVVFQDRRGHMWRPQNDDGKFAGPMRVRDALVRSRNLVSVRLLDAIGVDYARKYISHFGFDEATLPPNLSMSLGTASLTPLSVARGFATFANGGFRITPWFIDEVKDRDGALVFKEKPANGCHGCGGAATASGGAIRAPSTVVDGFDLGPGAPAPAAANDGKTDPKAKDKVVAKPKPKPVNTGDMLLAPRAIDERIAYQMVSMLRDVVLARHGYRGEGPGSRGRRRQDRFDQRASRRVVLRLGRPPRHHGMGRPRRLQIAGLPRIRRQGGIADLDRLHARGAQGPADRAERPTRWHGQGLGRSRRPPDPRQQRRGSSNGSRPRTWNAWRATPTTAPTNPPCRPRSRLISSDLPAPHGRPRRAPSSSSCQPRRSPCTATPDNTPMRTPKPSPANAATA